MKNILKIILVMSCFTLSASADKLPDEAKREIQKLKNTIKNAERETEKKIVRKKEDVIRELERAEKRISNEFAKNLIKLQIVKYRKEIKESEAKRDNDKKGRNRNKDEEAEAMQDQVKDAARIIDFGKSYFYRHPLEKYKAEIGEFKFYANGKVHCYHRTGTKVNIFKKWDWSIKEGKMVIKADHFHGPIYVSKKSPSEIYLDWKGMVNKKNVAKQK